MSVPAGSGNILLAGASGLVGSALAALLPPDQLICMGRAHNAALPAAVRQIVVDPGDWTAEIAALAPSLAISTLGTTIRKAGSQAAFAAIDLELVASFAHAARAAGARHFMMVSSVGASEESRNFYLATKGRAEAAVRAAGFDRVDILRPGLLRGTRSERRVGERLAMLASPITDALTPAAFDKYRSVEAKRVAVAMARLANKSEPGIAIHYWREIMSA